MKKNTFIFVCCCLVLTGCSKKSYIQDEYLAIKTANNFIEAIMNQDYEKAYNDYMSAGVKFGPQSTLDYFRADWEAIIEKYGPMAKATFDAWQAVPGKRALQLYYNISHHNVEEPVVYHFVLEGYQKTGYTIFIVDIGNQTTYPPNVTELPPLQKKDEKIELLPGDEKTE